MSVKYIPLRVHSSYSILESTIEIKKLVSFCVKNNIPAVAVNDTGNMFGAYEFSREATQNGVQPIISCQVKLMHDEKIYVVSLIAKSESGYQNIIKILSDSYIKNCDDQRGIISLNDLENVETILLFSYRNFLNHKDNEKIILDLKSKFSLDLYLEVSIKKETDILKMAYQNNIPIVAVNEAHFFYQDDYESYQVLRCISKGEYINSYKSDLVSKDNFLMTEETICEIFHDFPEALENTVKIAKKACFFLTPKNVEFPYFDCEFFKNETQQINEAKELIYFSITNLYYRMVEIFQLKKNDEFDKEIFNYTLNNDISLKENDLMEIINEYINEKALKYFKQAIYELNVIISMGFSGYFLIVSDFIRWAKNNDILVGPGRGSGAGSVVAWSAKITEVDPIRYSLIFERFLNPDRVSLPDFDIDFCQARRDEVIQYVTRKYGSEKVAHIITFGKLQAKAVIRDVGRVLQMPYKKTEAIANMIPFSAIKTVSLHEALENQKQMQEMRDNDYEVAKLFRIALKLEGLQRNLSTHAAGIIIGSTDLNKVIPLYREHGSDLPITQFSMNYIEPSSLIKFDFLGLKTLTIIQKAIKLTGEDIDINKIPVNDKKTYDFLKTKKTMGIFQLEGSGMSETLEKLEAENIEAISTLISLYRPGPMENISDYIAFRHGRKEPTYSYDCLRPILEETYGIPVYQEQVMQIAQVLAGYSLAEADLLRRAMGKKNQKAMEEHEKRFINQANKIHGGGEKKAQEVFNTIASFAGYAFNKAHAAAYAIISYQTAWLKANYTVEFYTALMILDSGNSDKLSAIYQESRKLNVKILLPDINKSNADFSIENTENEKAIRYGLTAIKGLGARAMQIIEDERKQNGPYTSIFDLTKRVPNGTLNKRQLEHMIFAGVFDELHSNRNQLYKSIPDILSNQPSDNVMMLFDQEDIRKPLKDVKDWKKSEKLAREFEVFGFYIKDHPILDYKSHPDYFSGATTLSVYSKLKKQGEVKMFATLEMINKRVVHKTREKYAFLKISDNYGMCEITIFPKALLEYENILVEGKNYIFTISKRKNDDSTRLICKKITALTEEHIKNTTVLQKSEAPLPSKALDIVYEIKCRSDFAKLKNIIEKRKPWLKQNKISIYINIEINLMFFIVKVV